VVRANRAEVAGGLDPVGTQEGTRATDAEVDSARLDPVVERLEQEHVTTGTVDDLQTVAAGMPDVEVAVCPARQVRCHRRAVPYDSAEELAATLMVGAEGDPLTAVDPGRPHGKRQLDDRSEKIRLKVPDPSTSSHNWLAVPPR